MKKSILIVFVLTFILVACSGVATPEDIPAVTATTEKMIVPTPSPVPPTAEPTETAIGDTLTETDVMTLLSSDLLDLENLFANVDQETFGPILTMQLVNQSDGELIVEIPCGLIFVPDDGDEQPLIVVQSQSIAIPFEETAELTPYVVCADISAGAPSLAATYSVGTLTENMKMQQLADCICDRGFDTSLYSEDGVSVQFAVWYVQMSGDPAGYLTAHADEIAASGLDDFDGSDENLDMMVEIFDDYLGDWITSCGIEFE